MENINKQQEETTKKDKKIKIISINVRSIYRRKEQITQFLHKEKVDIACIQETWLNSNDYEPQIKNYNGIYNKKREKRGGGVAIFIKKGIAYKNIKNYTNNEGLEFNHIIINDKNTKKKVYICNVYLTPTANKDQINILIEQIKKMEAKQ